MTALDKPSRGVVRLSRDAYSVLFASKAKARRIVVELLYGDVIEFREHGRRARFAVPIANAFRYAVNCAALATRREKAAAAIERKQAATRERAEHRLSREARKGGAQ